MSTSLQKKSDFDFLSLATNRRFWSIFAWIRSYNTQNFILSKMSTSVSFLKYSSNFADFCFDILTKYILTKKKKSVARTDDNNNSPLATTIC